MRPSVVVTFRAHGEQRRACEEVLAPFGGIAFLPDAEQEPGARTAMLGTAGVVITWLPDHELTEDDIGALSHVGLIQLVTAGADHVDFARLPEGAKIAGNVGAYADPMAEHVLALVLALAKRLPRGHARLASGTFDVAETLRMRGRAACILGYGGIGRACARLMRAFGMRIYAINSSGRAPDADRAGTLADLPGMLAAADVLIVALPLTRATRGLIGAAELALMKPDAILVNVARGAVVDEDALFDHLKANPEFTAGIDVWWDEPGYGKPFHPRLPFLSLPNVIGSPHNSGIVPGITTETVAIAARNVAAFLRGDPIKGVMDPADYAAGDTQNQPT
jgi:phosphoglycerate dehydrogenase-like enzyme